MSIPVKMEEGYGCTLYYMDDAGKIFHRDDGPAFIVHDVRRVWYQLGKKHRTDGPAYIHVDGTEKWFIRGVEITAKVREWLIEMNFPPFTEWTSRHEVLFKLAWSDHSHIY